MRLPWIANHTDKAHKGSHILPFLSLSVKVEFGQLPLSACRPADVAVYWLGRRGNGVPQGGLSEMGDGRVCPRIPKEKASENRLPNMPSSFGPPGR